MAVGEGASCRMRAAVEEGVGEEENSPCLQTPAKLSSLLCSRGLLASMSAAGSYCMLICDGCSCGMPRPWTTVPALLQQS